MAHTNLNSLFTDIADAIREKDGTSNSIVADDFPDRISAIPTNGESGETPTSATIYKIYEYRKAVIAENKSYSSYYAGTLQSIKIADYLPSGVDVSTLTVDNFLVVPNYTSNSYSVYSCNTKAASSSVYYGGAVRPTSIVKNLTATGYFQFAVPIAWGYSSKTGTSGAVSCNTNSCLYYLDCDVYYVPNNIIVQDLINS